MEHKFLSTARVSQKMTPFALGKLSVHYLLCMPNLFPQQEVVIVVHDWKKDTLFLVLDYMMP